MKPRLFIGSSSEALYIARALRKMLARSVDVHIWDQTFTLGDSTLTSLRRQVLLSEFALLIVTPDDPVLKRGKRGYSARDNVLFELGLFMGALGQHRSFYLVVTDSRTSKARKVLMLSDLDGICRLELEIKDNDYAADLRKICATIRDSIERASQENELNVLPSTSLAIGYFHNFVVQVCQKLLHIPSLKCGTTSIKLTRDAFDFNIVLPDSPGDASHKMFQAFTQKRNLTQVKITGEDRARKFPFFVDTTVTNGRLQVYDYPTTLRAAYEAIKIADKGTLIGSERALLEKREIRNFRATLTRLLESEPDSATFRNFVHIRYASELPALQ